VSKGQSELQIQIPVKISAD